MKVARTKLFRHSIEVSRDSLIAFYNLVDATKVRDDSDPPTSMLLSRPGHPGGEVELEELLSDPNEKSRCISSITISKTTDAQGLSIFLGFTEYHSVLCSS